MAIDIKAWCKQIVEGAGGLIAYDRRERRRPANRLESVEFAIRCLANPDCEGSGEVMQTILEQRAKKLADKPR